MPVPAVVSAIVSSVVNSIADLPPEPPPAPVYSSMARPFPAESKSGTLAPPVGREVQINGVQLAAAPGLQIRNSQNLIVMPASLQESVPVRYQLDPMGNVWRIWILSAAEVAAAGSNP